MKKPTLLPCPFCGEAAEIKAWHERTGAYRSAVEITCQGCGVQFSSERRNASAPFLREMQQEQMVKAWNRRVTP